MNPNCTVAATVKRGLLAYPSIYSTPADVLHQLFAVIGNGYEWEGGQLVPLFDEKESADEWLAQKLADARKMKLDGLILWHEELQHRYAFTKANIDRIVHHGEQRYEGKLYPLSDYSRAKTTDAPSPPNQAAPHPRART